MGYVVCEFFECVAELREAARSEQLGDLALDGLRVTVDGLFEAASLDGESNDAGAPVGRIGLSGEVAALFEVTQEVVDRLSCDLKLVGEGGRALPVEGGMAKQSDMG